LKEIPDNIKGEIVIKPVKWIDEVLEIALQRMPEPLEPETVNKAESDEDHRISAH